VNDTSGPGERVTTEDLRTALERSLASDSGSARAVARLDRAPCVFASSFSLEELEVELDDGTHLNLMFKDLGENGLSEGARAAKPPFLYDPMREIEAYTSILSSAKLGTASFYGSSVDAAQGRYWLFIENVRGVALWQIGELEVWQRAARWAAVLHDLFAGDSAPAGDHLLRYDADFFRMWLRRSVEFADRWEARRPGARKGIEWLARSYDQVVERLAALPVTFIHGEFYASNVLVAQEGDGPRVCPIDWEIAAIGPGHLDLAALTMGWEEHERVALATAYREGHAARLPAPEDFLEDLDHARLHLAVQWLGWAPDWRPPRSHRRDWVGEALGIAEGLGL
jgi:phosphotransferase family enzyme